MVTILDHRCAGIDRLERVAAAGTQLRFTLSAFDGAKRGNKHRYARREVHQATGVIQGSRCFFNLLADYVSKLSPKMLRPPAGTAEIVSFASTDPPHLSGRFRSC
jgi:hypothetical protein